MSIFIYHYYSFGFVCTLKKENFIFRFIIIPKKMIYWTPNKYRWLKYLTNLIRVKKNSLFYNIIQHPALHLIQNEKDSNYI